MLIFLRHIYRSASSRSRECVMCSSFPGTSNSTPFIHYPHRTLSSESSGTTKDSTPGESTKPKIEEKPESDTMQKLNQFFDAKETWGKTKVTSGRPWSAEELRLKDSVDLHKLWFVLLKERNMLLTMQYAYKEAYWQMPSEERIDKVEESMKNVEEVVAERNRAALELEGEVFQRPTRSVTSPIGFRVTKHLNEHILPPHMNQDVKKEYEEPYLEEVSEQFQKLYKEKEWFIRRDREDDRKRKLGLHQQIYQY